MMISITVPLVPSAITLLWGVAGLFVLAEEQDTTPKDAFNWLGYCVSVFLMSYGVSAMIQHGFGG